MGEQAIFLNLFEVLNDGRLVVIGVWRRALPAHLQRSAIPTEHRHLVLLRMLAQPRRLKMLLRNLHLQDSLDFFLVLVESVAPNIRIVAFSKYSLICLFLDNLVDVLEFAVEVASLR